MTDPGDIGMSTSSRLDAGGLAEYGIEGAAASSLRWQVNWERKHPDQALTPAADAAARFDEHVATTNDVLTSAESKVPELMQALEDSVTAAKAARQAVAAGRVPCENEWPDYVRYDDEPQHPIACSCSGRSWFPPHADSGPKEGDRG